MNKNGYNQNVSMSVSLQRNAVKTNGKKAVTIQRPRCKTTVVRDPLKNINKNIQHNVRKCVCVLTWLESLNDPNQLLSADVLVA